MELSVAICTYKRLEPFRATLESLSVCLPIGINWELLIVDNGCDTAIQQIARGFESTLPLRYIPEPTLGTSHARNRATREAAAPVILFTDDDVTFDLRWLTCMVAAIANHPGCAFWGGRVEPVWSITAPAWFDMKRCPMLGDCVVRYQQGDEPRYWDADRDPPFYTANLALRVDRISDAGYFDTTVGHRGGVRMGMEDSLMVQAIHRAGGKGWYAADAVVHHPVTADRLTKPYARRFAWRQGWMSVEQVARQSRVDSDHDNGGSPSPRPAKIPRWFYRVNVEQVLTGAWRWFNGLIRFDSAGRFAGGFVALFNLSKLWHALSRRSGR